MSWLIRLLLILSCTPVTSSSANCPKSWTKVEVSAFAYCRPGPWIDIENGANGRFLCNGNNGGDGRECVLPRGGLPRRGKAVIVIAAHPRHKDHRNGPTTLDEFLKEMMRPYQDRVTRDGAFSNFRGDQFRVVQFDYRWAVSEEVHYLVRVYTFATPKRFLLLDLTFSPDDPQSDEYLEIAYQILRTLEVKE